MVQSQAALAAVVADKILPLPISALKPHARNARTHSKAQLKQIARSIERFGFTNLVLINESCDILAGHGRVEAAKLLGWGQVPTICLSHLSKAEQRAYIIADNKLALNAGWDETLLRLELGELAELEFDLDLTGFSIAEIDQIIIGDAPEAEEDEDVPVAEGIPVTQSGDVWIMDKHRLICADARDHGACALLMGGEQAHLLFTDPPYNVPIDGHVSGLGKQTHREFAFASGEMSQEAFTRFLVEAMQPSAEALKDGAIAFVCMDWRHMGELLAAGNQLFDEFKNLIVWVKSNGGMGTFYRSRHELIFVFKKGKAAHTNSFGLGETGRYRTNVWEYAGMSSMGRSRDEALAMHPTVKPVALIADALKDCTQRGEIVLDCFGGSGSTLIAAEMTGRKARLIEYDPLYCDTIVQRWQKRSGKLAVREADGARWLDAHAASLEGERA